MGQYEKIDSMTSYEAIFFGDASETSSNDTNGAETRILNHKCAPFYSIGKGELMIVD
jgi:hypothetical protein